MKQDIIDIDDIHEFLKGASIEKDTIDINIVMKHGNGLLNKDDIRIKQLSSKVQMRGSISCGNMFAGRSFRSKIDAVISPGTGRIALTYLYFTDGLMGIDAGALKNEVAYNIEWVGFIENTGRSFRQYKIGVTKINISLGKPKGYASLGKPKELFVYGGYGTNKTIDLAVNDNVIAVPEHLIGNLTAVLFNDTSEMIRKS